MNAIGAPGVLNFDHCIFHWIIHFYFKNVQFLRFITHFCTILTREHTFCISNNPMIRFRRISEFLPTLPYKYDHCGLVTLFVPNLFLKTWVRAPKKALDLETKPLFLQRILIITSSFCRERGFQNSMLFLSMNPGFLLMKNVTNELFEQTRVSKKSKILTQSSMLVDLKKVRKTRLTTSKNSLWEKRFPTCKL